MNKTAFIAVKTSFIILILSTTLSDKLKNDINQFHIILKIANHNVHLHLKHYLKSSIDGRYILKKRVYTFEWECNRANRTVSFILINSWDLPIFYLFWKTNASQYITFPCYTIPIKWTLYPLVFIKKSVIISHLIKWSIIHTDRR